MRQKHEKPLLQRNTGFSMEAESSSTQTTTAMMLAVAAKDNLEISF
jgi:hypothetical protein